MFLNHTLQNLIHLLGNPIHSLISAINTIDPTQPRNKLSDRKAPNNSINSCKTNKNFFPFSDSPYFLPKTDLPIPPLLSSPNMALKSTGRLSDSSIFFTKRAVSSSLMEREV